MKRVPLDQEKKTIRLSSWLGVTVAVFELAMFIVSGSQAILIDGVYDAMDVVILVTYQMLLPLIYKPVSERIPFGFAQVETLFILIKGSVLIVVTSMIIYNDIVIILNGGTSIDTKQVLIFEAFLTLFCIFGYFVVRRYAATLVVGLDQLKIALAARDDDNLRQTERGCQPSGRSHIVGLDAQAHQVNTFLRDKQARPDQQEADEFARVQLLSPALFLSHQIMPSFCAKRYRTVTSCSRVIMSCHMKFAEPSGSGAPPCTMPLLTAHWRAASLQSLQSLS